MSFNFNEYKKNIKETGDWLRSNFSSIRTGSASSAILDNIKIKAYGGLSPINQLASIGIEDSQTLLVIPFDSSIIREFEKAIQDSKLDLNMSVSGNSIRISFPNLTSDRKKMLIKLAKERLEESRVRLRKYRDDTKNKIEEKHKNSEINEDMKFSLKEEMEKITKEANNELEKMFQKKEEEIFS